MFDKLFKNSPITEYKKRTKILKSKYTEVNMHEVDLKFTISFNGEVVHVVKTLKGDSNWHQSVFKGTYKSIFRTIKTHEGNDETFNYKLKEPQIDEGSQHIDASELYQWYVNEFLGTEVAIEHGRKTILGKLVAVEELEVRDFIGYCSVYYIENVDQSCIN